MLNGTHHFTRRLSANIVSISNFISYLHTSLKFSIRCIFCLRFCILNSIRYRVRFFWSSLANLPSRNNTSEIIQIFFLQLELIQLHATRFIDESIDLTFSRFLIG